MSRTLRDAVVLVVVTAVLAVSLALFAQATGFASPWFGAMLMFNVLGVIAFARPLFLLKLPRAMRQIRAFEARGAFYKAILVPQFGSMLRRTPLRHLNPLVYLGPHPDDASRVLAQAESAEAAHFLAIPVLIPYILHAWNGRRWAAVACLMAVEVGFNVYPILHLRWMRYRLDRVRGRILARRAGRG